MPRSDRLYGDDTLLASFRQPRHVANSSANFSQSPTPDRRLRERPVMSRDASPPREHLDERGPSDMCLQSQPRARRRRLGSLRAYFCDAVPNRFPLPVAACLDAARSDRTRRREAECRRAGRSALFLSTKSRRKRVGMAMGSPRVGPHASRAQGAARSPRSSSFAEVLTPTPLPWLVGVGATTVTLIG